MDLPARVPDLAGRMRVDLKNTMNLKYPEPVIRILNLNLNLFEFELVFEFVFEFVFQFVFEFVFETVFNLPINFGVRLHGGKSP